MYTPLVVHRQHCAASPSRTLPLVPKTLGYPLPLLISHTQYTFAWILLCIPTHIFFRSHSPRWSSEIVSVVFYNVISSDAFWRSYQSDSVCECDAVQCSFNLKLHPLPQLLPPSPPYPLKTNTSVKQPLPVYLYICKQSYSDSSTSQMANYNPSICLNYNIINVHIIRLRSYV